jgi:hypothetical protein
MPIFMSSSHYRSATVVQHAANWSVPVCIQDRQQFFFGVAPIGDMLRFCALSFDLGDSWTFVFANASAWR